MGFFYLVPALTFTLKLLHVVIVHCTFIKHTSIIYLRSTLATTSSISAFLLAPLLIINLVLKILIESLHFIKSDGSN